MTLTLDLGTVPEGLPCKSHGHAPIIDGLSGRIRIGDYELTMEDFLMLVHYVMTNTDLVPNDPRLSALEMLKEAKVVPGWNRHGLPGGDSECLRIDMSCDLLTGGRFDERTKSE